MVQIEITIATLPEDVAAARQLFEEYAAWLGFSLCFQGFDQELATLPGKYALPTGRLLLAKCDGAPAGCIALRPIQPGICEMKRLYVRPQFRGLALGRKFVERLLSEAKIIGYTSMRLDTISEKMPEAVKLYRSFGFVEVAPYYSTPEPHTLFLELKLD